MTARPIWTPVDSATAPGLTATLNGHTVFVSTFDEGPTRPAFYWQIDDRRGLYFIWHLAVNVWESQVLPARASAYHVPAYT